MTLARKAAPATSTKPTNEPDDLVAEASGARLAAEPAPGDAEAPSLTGKALSGVAWNWGGSAVLIAAQIASTAATARLVAPSEFGVYATAQVAAGLTGYFTLNAVGPGLQRRSQLGEKTIGTALTLSLAAAAIVATVLWVAAPLWASVWGIADAVWTVRALAVALFLMSLTVVPLAIISRRLQFATVAIIETGSLVVGLAAGVALAVELQSAVALALGQAIAAAALLATATWLSRDRLQLSFDRADARELFAFATQVGGLGLFTYVSIAAPSFFVARVFGASTLGLYSRANLIVALPAEYVLRSIFKVIYPLYGRVREDLARTKTLVDEALTLTTGLIWPLFALVAGAAPVIVAILLGDRWRDAAPLLSIFAVIVSGWVPCGLLTNAAEAFGWMRTIAARQLAFFAGTVATMLVVYLADLDLDWLLVGIALTEAFVYILTLRPFFKRRYLDTGRTLRHQSIHLAIALAAFGAATGCAHLLGEAALPVQAVGQLGVGAIVALIVVLGWRWVPATRVLGRRVGAGPHRGIVRASWEALS